MFSFVVNDLSHPWDKIVKKSGFDPSGRLGSHGVLGETLDGAGVAAVLEYRWVPPKNCMASTIS